MPDATLTLQDTPCSGKVQHHFTHQHKVFVQEPLHGNLGTSGLLQTTKSTTSFIIQGQADLIAP